MPHPVLMLWRGVRKRCPRCGTGGLFRRWFLLVPVCPGCELRFEREEGAWLGSMALNIGFAEIAFGAFLLGGILLTWPDVPWGWLTAGAIAVNLVVPIALFPVTKTLWAAVDLLLHRMDPAEAQPR